MITLVVAEEEGEGAFRVEAAASCWEQAWAWDKADDTMQSEGPGSHLVRGTALRVDDARAPPLRKGRTLEG